MWRHGSQPRSSSSTEVDFLNVCTLSARSIEELVSGGNLLNQRQCQDLSAKLSKTTLNIRELVILSGSGASADLFPPALKHLYRYLEKAKVLVKDCGEEDWCAAAVFQIQNGNALREILLDISLCYNTIYEQAKSTGASWNVHPEDLRYSPTFVPATDGDILKDQLDLQKRLHDLANASPGRARLLDRFHSNRGALKQSLARYLLAKLDFTSDLSEANTLDAILWRKENEPSGAWGKDSRFLGSGAGSSGVSSRRWLGIPCAKKGFDGPGTESFFLKEAGILARLKHPCIIDFICCGDGQEKGGRFIAMALMEKSLSDLIRDQKDEYFSLPVVVDLMVQMARGMRYLHDKGVAHRDLKPHNVVVNRMNSPYLGDYFFLKLVDFGMSKTKIEASKSNTISVRGVGTTRYRAPEVHPDANSSGKVKATWFKADAFSFAMTCSHLLSLETPFKDIERLSELYNILKIGQRPKLPSIYPKELVDILKDCWDTNPMARPSFKDICIRLEAMKHKSLRGFSTPNQGLQVKKMELGIGLDFIKSKMEEHSFGNSNNEVEFIGSYVFLA